MQWHSEAVATGKFARRRWFLSGGWEQAMDPHLRLFPCGNRHLEAAREQDGWRLLPLHCTLTTKALAKVAWEVPAAW